MPAAAVLALACGLAAPAPAAPADADVRAAIVRAVQARVDGAEVSIAALRVRGAAGGPGLAAAPDAGSRAGGPMRFVLRAGAETRAPRLGSADAVVTIRVRHARTTRALAPGTILTAADLVEQVGDPGRVALQALPAAAALVGTRARRALPAGAAVAADAVTLAPLVRGGDEVGTTIRIGAVTATGRAIALEDGVLGAVVRVQVDRRRLRGRVRGAGEVEITP